MECVKYISDDQHPLLNNVVLDNLFKIMEFNIYDYKNYRLVWHTWYEVSNVSWRKKVWLSLVDKEVKENYLCRPVKVDTFMALLELPGDSFGLRRYPYVKFLIKNVVIQLQDLPNKRKRRFWEVIGEHMTHVAFKECSFHDVRGFRQVLFELTPKLQYLALEWNKYFPERPTIRSEQLNPNRLAHGMPEKVQDNLRELHLAIEGSDGGTLEKTSDLPVSWLEFLIRFPKIQTLDLSRICKIRKLDEVLEIFEAMKTIRDTFGEGYYSNLNMLSTLDMENNSLQVFSPQMVLPLERLQLPLKVLHVDLGYNTDNETTVRILQAHSQSLEELHIFRASFATHFPGIEIGFNLPNLTTLVATGPIFSDLNFLRQMTNLKILKLNYWRCREDVKLEKCRLGRMGITVQLGRCIRLFCDLTQGAYEGIVLNDLHTFFVNDEILLDTELEALAKVMPNLRNLHVGFDNEGFKIVCQYWRNLEELEINRNWVSESGILGTFRRTMFHFPNLTDLKYLKVFKISSLENRRIQMGLTNNSVRCGLLKMENLEVVDAFISRKIYEKSSQELLTRFPRKGGSSFHWV